MNILKIECPIILLDFLDYLKIVKGFTEKTIEAYKLDLLMFMYFYKKYHKLKTKVKDFNLFLFMQIKTKDVIAFLVYLNFHRDNNAFSRQRRISILRRFFKWLKGLYPENFKENPLDNLGSISKFERLPKYIPLQKAKQLQTIFNCKNSKYSLRNNAIITLFLTSGVRLNELINIKIKDINWDKNTIVVFGKGRKYRAIYLNAFSKKQIEKYLEFRKRRYGFIEDNSYLFLNNKGQKIGTDGIEYIVQKAYNLAGLNSYGYTIHTLRHTAATIMYNHAHDILLLREFLGHKSVVTSQVYMHVYDDRLHNLAEKNPLNYSEKKAA